ncbi:MAG TPA: hypothetical protein VM122_00915 [Usitatibacter sp.]|nr:hypothetical protein [Usitatibacter sp.]
MDHDRLFLTAAIAASVALGTPMVKAADSYSGLEARVQAIAEQGPDALRHFIYRTRMIYALQFADYARPWGDDQDTDPGPQGFWPGVPGFEADPMWLQAAAFTQDEATPGRD